MALRPSTAPGTGCGCTRCATCSESSGRPRTSPSISVFLPRRRGRRWRSSSRTASSPRASSPSCGTGTTSSWSGRAAARRSTAAAASTGWRSASRAWGSGSGWRASSRWRTARSIWPSCSWPWSRGAASSTWLTAIGWSSTRSSGRAWARPRAGSAGGWRAGSPCCTPPSWRSCASRAPASTRRRPGGIDWRRSTRRRPWSPTCPPTSRPSFAPTRSRAIAGSPASRSGQGARCWPTTWGSARRSRPWPCCCGGATARRSSSVRRRWGGTG